MNWLIKYHSCSMQAAKMFCLFLFFFHFIYLLFICFWFWVNTTFRGSFRTTCRNDFLLIVLRGTTIRLLPNSNDTCCIRRKIEQKYESTEMRIHNARLYSLQLIWSIKVLSFMNCFWQYWLIFGFFKFLIQTESPKNNSSR